MTKRSILSLACKVFGVIFLAEAIASIPSIIRVSMALARGSADIGGPTANILLEIGSLVLSFALASILVGSSDGIARMLIPDDQEVVLPDVRANGRAILALASRVVGIVLIARGLPGILQLFSQYALAVYYAGGVSAGLREAFGYTTQRMLAEQWAAVIGYSATIVIGLCLVLFADRLSALLYPAEPGCDQGDI